MNENYKQPGTVDLSVLSRIDWNRYTTVQLNVPAFFIHGVFSAIGTAFGIQGITGQTLADSIVVTGALSLDRISTTLTGGQAGQGQNQNLRAMGGV